MEGEISELYNFNYNCLYNNIIIFRKMFKISEKYFIIKISFIII